MSLLTNLPLFILLLGVLIFVHELGHFLVAKAFGIKVVRFSLGFGPRIFGFRKGETDYRVSLLPLGGYVKMAGDDPTEELAPEDRGRGYLEQRPYKRMLVAFAGPAMNLMFPLLVWFVVLLGQREGVAAHIGHVVPGMPAAEAGLVPGDDITAIDGERIVNFEDLQRAVNPAAGRPLAVTVRRGDQDLTFTITPVRAEEKNVLETVIQGRIGISPNPHAPVIGVQPGPARAAGLRSLDRLAAVAGTKVGSLEDALGKLEAAYAAGAPFEVEVVRPRPMDVGSVSVPLDNAVKVTVVPRPGESLGVESGDLYVSEVVAGTPAAAIGLAPGDKLLAAAGKDLRAWSDLEQLRRESNEKPFSLAFLHDGQRVETEIAQAATTIKDELRGRDVITYTFGAAGGLPGLAPPLVDLPFRPLLAAQVSVSATWDMTRQMVLGLGMLFSGQIALSNIGGPLQIYDLTSRAAEIGWTAFLQIMALISINLGLLNLLPVPVLDGGHVVQAGIEMVRRQPLSLRTREVANLVGLVLLVTLMLFALKNDVVRFLLAG